MALELSKQEFHFYRLILAQIIIHTTFSFNINYHVTKMATFSATEDNLTLQK